MSTAQAPYPFIIELLTLTLASPPAPTIAA
jgi:hypothetical protein